jgi:quinolinate synthase
MSDEEMHERIELARKELGKRLVVLGHHYQRDDVIRHADLTGDSYQLSVMASQTDAEFIVFCGVHFMAESADILGKPQQRVILPDLGAGCSMADMATIDQVEDAWEQLREIGILQNKVAPITYMNSSAAIKAFCGRNEGVVCTSSNAIPLFDIYLKEYDKMFFFPDQHLGRNTGAKFGIPLDKMVLWNPHEELGGNTEEALHNAKLILWRGHCSVHGRRDRFGPSGVHARGGGNERPRRFDVVHHQDGRKFAGGVEVRDRHRSQSRQPAAAAFPR